MMQSPKRGHQRESPGQASAQKSRSLLRNFDSIVAARTDVVNASALVLVKSGASSFPNQQPPPKNSRSSSAFLDFVVRSPEAFVRAAAPAARGDTDAATRTLLQDDGAGPALTTCGSCSREEDASTGHRAESAKSTGHRADCAGTPSIGLLAPSSPAPGSSTTAATSSAPSVDDTSHAKQPEPNIEGRPRQQEEEPTADGAQEAKSTDPVPEEPSKNPPPPLNPPRRRDSFLDRYLSDELASRLRLAVSAIHDPISQNNLRETEVDDEFDEMGSMLPDEEASCMEELLSEEDDDGVDDDGVDNGNEDSLDDEADANDEADVHDGNRETKTEKTKPGAAPSLTLSPRPRPAPVGRSPGGVLEKARQCAESHRGFPTMRPVSLSKPGANMLNDAQMGTQSMKLNVTQLLAPPGSFPSGATAQPQRPASASDADGHRRKTEPAQAAEQAVSSSCARVVVPSSPRNSAQLLSLPRSLQGSSSTTASGSAPLRPRSANATHRNYRGQPTSASTSSSKALVPWRTSSSTSNHPPEAMLKSPRVSRRDPRFGHIEDALRSRPSEWVVGPNGPREKGQVIQERIAREQRLERKNRKSAASETGNKKSQTISSQTLGTRHSGGAVPVAGLSTSSAPPVGGVVGGGMLGGILGKGPRHLSASSTQIGKQDTPRGLRSSSSWITKMSTADLPLMAAKSPLLPPKTHGVEKEKEKEKPSGERTTTAPNVPSLPAETTSANLSAASPGEERLPKEGRGGSEAELSSHGSDANSKRPSDEQKIAARWEMKEVPESNCGDCGPSPPPGPGSIAPPLPATSSSLLAVGMGEAREPKLFSTVRKSASSSSPFIVSSNGGELSSPLAAACRSPMARVLGDAKSSAASEYDDAAPFAATPPDPREPATATAGAHLPSASTQRVSGSTTSFANAPATDSQRRKRRSSLVSSGQNHLSVRLGRGGQTVGEEQAEDVEEGFVYHSPCGEKSQEMKLLEQRSQNPSRRPSGCIVLDGGGGSFLHMKTAFSGGATASVPVSTVGAELGSNEFEAKFEKFKADAERLRKKLDKLQRSEQE